MAEVITRFKLETTKFDSQLRDAAKGLTDVVHIAELGGKSFGGFSQKSVEAARALGQTASGATNAKDKVRDLVGAYNEAANAYNKLTKEQQQSDFGKALAESLGQLKTRLTEAKTELYGLGDSGKGTSGIMDALKDKITLSFDAVKLLNVGLQGAKAALDVAKDAFFASEASVDEWGRTMKSAEGLYEGFLNAINNGDISGYLSRMDDIVKAAREAYNAMDTLQTMKTIQSPQFAKQEAENNRIRMMIQTGRWMSAGDGRKSPLGLKDGDLLSPAQIRILERQLQGGMNKIVSLTKNELGQTGKAIDAYYNSLAKQNGMSLSEFRQGTSNWGAFSEKMAGYESYKKWDAQARAEFARQGGQGFVNFDKSNPYAEYRKWGTFRVDKMGENSYNDLVNLIKQQQQQQSQMYSTIGQAYRTINRAEGVSTRQILNGGGNGGGGASKAAQTVEMFSIDLKDLQEKAMKDMTGGIKLPVELDIKSPVEKWKEEIASLQEMIKNAWSPEEIAVYQAKIEELETNIDKFSNKQEKGGKAGAASFREAASAISQVGGALQGIEDPGAKVMGIVAQAVASVALAFSDAIAKDQATKSNIFAFLGAAITSTAAMISMISQIHSATGYASGGVVQGTTFSGDQIPAFLNAGETVLTSAQTGVLASQLSGGGLNGYTLETDIEAEKLRILLVRNSKRRGSGYERLVI